MTVLELKQTWPGVVNAYAPQHLEAIATSLTENALQVVAFRTPKAGETFFAIIGIIQVITYDRDGYPYPRLIVKPLKYPSLSTTYTVEDIYPPESLKSVTDLLATHELLGFRHPQQNEEYIAKIGSLRRATFGPLETPRLIVRPHPVLPTSFTPAPITILQAYGYDPRPLLSAQGERGIDFRPPVKGERYFDRSKSKAEVADWPYTAPRIILAPRPN